MKIQPNDIISGSMYLKLIADYKAYDARQKAVIKRLQTDLDYLIFEHPDYGKSLEQARELRVLQERICQLRRENEKLLCRVIQLERGRL